MNAKIRDRIKHFLKFEGGRVGLKTPLALGIAGGSLLAAQAVFSPSAYSSHECYGDSDCDTGEACEYVCSGLELNGICYGTLVRKCVGTIKGTPLMLPLVIVGSILLWKQRKQTEETSRHFRMAVSLTVWVVLFTGCLSLTSKKFPRYLLPAFPMLEILAAIGFVEGLKWCSAVLRSRFGTQEAETYKPALAVIACVVFFFIQVMPVLVVHPYYGTYYNPCWKMTDITKIITVGSDASGLDIAAKYLNRKKNVTQFIESVRLYCLQGN